MHESVERIGPMPILLALARYDSALPRSVHIPATDPLGGHVATVKECHSDICSVSLHLGILVLRHLSYGRTTRRLPKLCRCRLPIEGVVARAVLFEVIEPGNRLLDARQVAGRHPPHHEIRPIEVLEPL